MGMYSYEVLKIK